MAGIAWKTTVSGRVSARLEQMLVGELEASGGSVAALNRWTRTFRTNPPERPTAMVAFPHAVRIIPGRCVA